MMTEFLFLLAPFIVMTVATLFILTAGAFGSNFRTVQLLSIGTLVLTGFAFAFLSPETSTLGFNGLLIRDSLSLFAAFVILAGLLFSLLLAAPWLREEGLERYEFQVLLLLSGVGMLLLVSAANLMLLYVALELQSLALYVLAAFRTRDIASGEAGLKYFLLGSLASGILLFGISLTYGFSGTLGFAPLAQLLADSKASGTPISLGLIVGLTLVVIGLAFKLSAAPFHMWTPDVYEGAPTPVSAALAMAPKVAVFIPLARLMLAEDAVALSLGLNQVLWILAALSMLWGSFAALPQTQIKRLLAYSAIGNAGYALMGVVAGTRFGLEALLVYMVIYLVSIAGVFACVISMRRDGQALESLDDLKGFAQHHPIVAMILAALMFSVAGVPPLAGFFGKLYVFRAALESGYIVLALIGALTSIVAAFYYLRLIRLMYFEEAEALANDRPIAPGVNFVMFLSSSLIVGFLLAPGSLVAAARLASLALFP